MERKGKGRAISKLAHRTSASMLDKGKIHGTIMDTGWNHRELRQQKMEVFVR